LAKVKPIVLDGGKVTPRTSKALTVPSQITRRDKPNIGGIATLITLFGGNLER